MYRKLILFFLINNLFANDFVDLYRNKGINEVQKKFEQILRSKDYWLESLKNKNIDLGYYESKKYVILTDKKSKKLSLYEKKNDDFIILSQDDVILGENPGDKLLEGDKKTPIGAYELTLKRSNLDQFYGPFALVTSYPNTFDKSLNKNGYGIWIHGMPLSGKRELYTQGCIALNNEKLKELDKKININEAVLLTSYEKLEKVKKEDIASILSFIYKWKEAWKISDIKTYLSFYSKEFKKKDGSDINEFKAYKTRVFNKNESKKIEFKDINISPYPNSLNKKMYRVSMAEKYTSPTVNFKGKKELYLEISDNQVKILTED